MKSLKQHGSHMIKLFLAFIVATILFLWGWNSAMPDLFGLPIMQFKQALGLMILIGIITFFLRGGIDGRKENTSPYHYDSVVEEHS
jgi:hypothetical protein